MFNLQQWYIFRAFPAAQVNAMMSVPQRRVVSGTDALVHWAGFRDQDGTLRSPSLRVQLSLDVPALKIPTSNVSVLVASGNGQLANTTFKVHAGHISQVPELLSESSVLLAVACLTPTHMGAHHCSSPPCFSPSITSL